DDVIIFSPLSTAEIAEIVNLQVKEIEERLETYGVTLDVTSEARQWLSDHGYDPVMGARPLKRALQKYLESPLAEQLLAGKFKNGDRILVKLDGDNELVFERGEAVEDK
ncbi:MAG TPA: ATP-dependent Clp protease ATP-binding subunit, partial [Anaerolineaceae bacterium]|nr:ATP-dependent Clp protease ATP-binding subunit [Anaerolineaceae bacterium]